MKPQAALEAIEAVRNKVPEFDRPQLDLSLARLALPPAVYEQITQEAPLAQVAPDSEILSATSVLESLTPEKRERATALQTAMAEKFSTKETPLTPEDFGVVLRGEGEEQEAVVMLTTDSGLYKGSYNSVMSSKKKNKQNYTVEVDGEEIDTRSAMTWETYQAFIEQAKANGADPLPDSRQLSEQNDQPWTGTWLTEEEADGFFAHFGDVGDGGPRRHWDFRDRDWSILRVRPAAVV